MRGESGRVDAQARGKRNRRTVVETPRQATWASPRRRRPSLGLAKARRRAPKPVGLAFRRLPDGGRRTSRRGGIPNRLPFPTCPRGGCVYVDRIAVAPRNRSWLVSEPLYKGVGVALLLRAICHSYILGLEGRVSLISLPSERTRQFYERRGFTRLGEDDDGMVEYEMDDEVAQRWLQQAGYLE